MRPIRSSTLRPLLYMLSLWALVACDQNTTQVEQDPGSAAATPEAQASPEAPKKRASVVGSVAQAAVPPPPPAPPDPLRHQPDLPPEQRTLLLKDGEMRWVDVDAAEAAGYQIVDLRDDWTPYIFAPMEGEDGEVMENRYRQIFIGLANDLTDSDGRPIPDEEDNYLEVFGIPPSLSVIQARFLGDEEKACHKSIDYETLSQLQAVNEPRTRSARRAAAAVEKHKKALKAAFKKHEVADYAALKAADPEAAHALEEAHLAVRSAELEPKGLALVEARLNCDDHNHKSYKHKEGKFDHGLRLALRRFQRKHKIYEHTNLRGETMVMMGKKPLETNWLALRRAITERVAAATSVVEDGTAKVKGEPITYTGKDGNVYPVRDLITEFTDAAMLQAGLETPEKALAFFKKYSKEDFQWLSVAVKFPPLPEYYEDHMDLEMIIDRGDVWYDPPFNAKGKPVHQSRGKMPTLSLYLKYNNQRFPLMRWATTIGGWREDQAANGYIYYKYKGSDVGKRVIRKVIAGPTWVPPESTPLRSLAKRRYVNGAAQGVVNYGEMGPGYLSAYGLVAGYFVVPGKDPDGRRDQDNGIRAHGSSDYMSIMSASRFSHGCHRLMNHQSVRMYGFLLHHRNVKVVGEQPINHSRQFLYEGEVYEIRLPSRGFRYDLIPPLPVNVLEGNVKGRTKKPITGFVKVPGRDYPDLDPGERPSNPDDKAGAEGAGGEDS